MENDIHNPKNTEYLIGVNDVTKEKFNKKMCWK
jgi:hypothetical protein